MEIKVAKTAGFCFGVNRAVELTYGLLAEGRRVATLGPLIHNPQAVADMQAKGAFVADSVPQVPDGYEVVIRSHGVPRSVYDELEARGIAYHDATCPFVQKIQRIAAEAEKDFDPIELVYPGEVPYFDRYDEFVPEELVRKGFAEGVLDIEGMKQRILGWRDHA